MVLDTVLENEISEIAKVYHKSEIEIVSEAIIVYKEYMNLLSEFQLWDLVSDQDFMKFEGSYC
jgi:hypothetical protein